MTGDCVILMEKPNSENFFPMLGKEYYWLNNEREIEMMTSLTKGGFPKILAAFSGFR